MSLRRAVATSVQFEVEGALSDRFPGALSPRLRTQHDRLPLGIASLDELLHGGLPSGGLSEVVGPMCSGRTTMATSLLARATQKECAAAWVDVTDTFDPVSAAQCGVDLRRLLWVRCQQQAEAVAVQSAPPGMVRPEIAPAQQLPKGGGSPHPRSEADGMPDAIAAMLTRYPSASAIPDKRARRVIGTPGAPNRPLVPFPAASPYREEQVGTDRMASRREEEFKKAEELQRQKQQGLVKRVPVRMEHGDRAAWVKRPTMAGNGAESVRRDPWDALDKALRTTDLLLHAGGFSVLVLDLGSVAPEKALRIPLSTWFRFRAACERARTTLMLLTQHACAKSSADLLVRLQPGEARVDGRVLTGFRFVAEVERARNVVSAVQGPIPFRKPPVREQRGMWQAQATWAMPR